MKIKNISFEKLVIPMNCEFHVAFGVISSSTSVIVKITADNGLAGYGEAAPFPFVTGESCEMVLHTLALFRQALVGMDAMNMEGIHAAMDGMIIHNASAKCAIDIALYDLYGKLAAKNITDADCDSFMFSRDPEMGMPGGYTVEGDLFTLSQEPCLGLSINF